MSISLDLITEKDYVDEVLVHATLPLLLLSFYTSPWCYFHPSAGF